jgi:hypothetical protein
VKRWTEAEIEALRRKMKQYEVEGKIKTRTHTIALPSETPCIPANKRGGRKSKYGAIKTEASGIKFHSRREAKRYMDLRMMEEAGEIKDLKRQVVYPIEVNGMKVCEYVADFVYEKGEIVVEDAKGYRTEMFNLKAKLMKAVHGVEVLLT